MSVVCCQMLTIVGRPYIPSAQISYRPSFQVSPSWQAYTYLGALRLTNTPSSHLSPTRHNSKAWRLLATYESQLEGRVEYIVELSPDRNLLAQYQPPCRHFPVFTISRLIRNVPQHQATPCLRSGQRSSTRRGHGQARSNRSRSRSRTRSSLGTRSSPTSSTATA